jgi:polysaccharide deacetylase family protein (PEP-CTERM system associated)
LIKEIQNQGHEIACHSYDHQLVYNMTPEEFRQDIRMSKKILEDIVGTEVIGYRAPSYSITGRSLWAFQILAEEGFRYDSSIFPIHHDRYGIPNAPRFPFVVDLNNGGSPKFVPLSNDTRSALCSISYAQNASTLDPRPSTLLMEFPISTVRLFGQNVPISGGGYFRFFPYRVAKRALARINYKERQPFMFYLHPWELDDKQPRIELLNLRSQFRHYTNLKHTEAKLRKLLEHFAFCSVRDILDRADGVTD